MNQEERISFEGSEQPVERGEDSILSHYLLVCLNNEKYLINLTIIAKIINPLEIFPLPDTLAFVSGVANFSGEIVPIVDLKRVLKMPEQGQFADRKFVICKYQEIKVGFMVDKVIDSRELDSTRIKTDTTRVLENDFISGEYIHDKEVLGVVDIAKFIETYKAD